MHHHPVAVAAAVATLVAGRDAPRLAAALTETARLRALLPGGPVESHGRADVSERICGWLADFDDVEVVESAGEPVGDRLLLHYRLHVGRGITRWVCTHAAVCTLVDGRLAVIDLLCSGLREVPDEHEPHQLSTPAPGARRVG